MRYAISERKSKRKSERKSKRKSERKSERKSKRKIYSLFSLLNLWKTIKKSIYMAQIIDI